MKVAHFSFLDDLSSLLPLANRNGTFEYTFSGPQSLKHLIESVGIPHTEIGELRANDRPVGLDYLVQNGDQIVVRGGPQVDGQYEEPLFVLDGHLGRLASRLRVLGLDCLYRNDYTDQELARVSGGEQRILLSRDRRLLMRKAITRGYLIRSLITEIQFQEVFQRYGLERWIRPFQRCPRCNHLLEAVSKEQVLDRLEPLTRMYFDEFHICPACQQIYWKGSHYEKLQRLISGLR